MMAKQAALDDIVNFCIEENMKRDSKNAGEKASFYFKLVDKIWKLACQDEETRVGNFEVTNKLAVKSGLETYFFLLPNIISGDDLDVEALIRLSLVLIQLHKLWETSENFKALALVVNKLTHKVIVDPECVPESSQKKLYILMDEVWELVKKDPETDLDGAKVLACLSPVSFETCVLEFIHSWLTWLKNTPENDRDDQIPDWFCEPLNPRIIGGIVLVPSLQKSANEIIQTIITMTGGNYHSLIHLAFLVENSRKLDEKEVELGNPWSLPFTIKYLTLNK